MTPLTRSGPGDNATWGACYGHPHDPRTLEFEEDDWPLDDEDADYNEDKPGEEIR